MIEAELLVAGRYSAVVTPFDCPPLGLVCGIRTAFESVICVVPDTAIQNPESLGRIHRSIRLCTPVELVKMLEKLSKAGAVALACCESEREMSDLYKKVPTHSMSSITLCHHLKTSSGLDDVFDHFSKSRINTVGWALYMLLGELSRFEPALFDMAAPTLSMLGQSHDQLVDYKELIRFEDLRTELKQQGRISESERDVQLQSICANGLSREVAMVRESLPDELEQLQHDFPNFAEVTRFLQAQVALGLRRQVPAQAWPPILLVGSPGCGKSAFCRRLTQIICNDYFGADLSHMLGRFELVGLHASWRSGASGFLANALIKSRYINPIIFLDEIDKANQRHQDGNLIDCLLTLLEPDSAKIYVDQFLKVPMDASRIIWFFAANDLNLIPAAARSRLQVFHIPQPSAQEQHHIIHQMYRGLVDSSDLEDVLDPEIPASVINLLVSSSVREVRLRLQLSIANAALRLKGTSYKIRLGPEDIPLPLNILMDDLQGERTLH